MKSVSLAALLALAGVGVFGGCSGEDDATGPSEPVIGVFATETVDSTLLTGFFPSVAVDGSGLPHVVYISQTQQDLMYARHNGSEWETSIVDPNVVGTGIASNTSIALDIFNHPHVAYRDPGEDELRYGWYDGVQWRITVIDSSEGAGKYASIALDSQDDPYISYGISSTAAAGAVYLAYFAGAEWNYERIDSVVALATSIAVLDPEQVYVAYKWGQFGEVLKFARRLAPRAWDTVSVDLDGSHGPYCSLEMSPEGVPSIAYYSEEERELRFAQRLDTNWIVETVDTADGSGLFVSHARDSFGRFHIAYQNDLEKSLRFALGRPGGWDFSTVDTVSSTGFFSNIALKFGLYPHIVYQSLFEYDLRHAVSKP